MSKPSFNFREVNELIELAIEGAITPEQSKLLDDSIVNNPVICRYYCEYIHLTVGIERSIEKIAATDLQECNAVFDEALWNELAEYERTAPAIEIPKEKPQRELIQKVVKPKVVYKVNKFSLYTAISSAAALVLLLLYARFAPPPASMVAMITDSVNAQWASSDLPTDIGSALWNDEGSRWLQKGIVKITFDYGADVIIEGPSEFQLLSAEKIALNTGRIYAKVPGQASGFTVETPSSTIIDLGTEFGVKVDVNGDTDVHMVKGKASLQPGIKGSKKESLILEAGRASRVDARTGTCREIVVDEHAFARKIPSPYERAVIQSRPFAYWCFEHDDSGKAINKLNPAELTGQMSGNYALVAGPNLGGSGENRALALRDFDSSVRIGNINMKRSKQTGYTMMMWVYLDQDHENQNLITSFSADQATARHICLAEGKFTNRPHSTNVVPLVTNDVVEAGRWYHVAQSLTAGGKRKFYVNGRQRLGQKDIAGKIFDDLRETVCIGTLPYSHGDAMGHKGFQGTVDEFALWGRELGATEISRIYEAAPVGREN